MLVIRASTSFWEGQNSTLTTHIFFMLRQGIWLSPSWTGRWRLGKLILPSLNSSATKAAKQGFESRQSDSEAMFLMTTGFPKEDQELSWSFSCLITGYALRSSNLRRGKLAMNDWARTSQTHIILFNPLKQLYKSKTPHFSSQISILKAKEVENIWPRSQITEGLSRDSGHPSSPPWSQRCTSSRCALLSFTQSSENIRLSLVTLKKKSKKISPVLFLKACTKQISIPKNLNQTRKV